ncbi:hypothetical protein F8R90_18165 [Nostoc sp. NZL]|nr:hypothetical protein [Nostoc sp. NZL]MBG1243036.1 hypothetical protein [Nostoc sp. NZL]
MHNSEQWPRLKQILRQAVVILDAIEKAMPGTPHINVVTRNKIAQAKKNISENLDTGNFDQVSSLLEYEELVKKLKASEMPITLEQLEEADKL